SAWPVDDGQGQAAAPTMQFAWPGDDGEREAAASTSLPTNPLDNPVVQEVIRLFNATVISITFGPRPLRHVQKVRSYSPVTLPSLPRPECPHKVLFESKGRLMKSRVCRKPTLAHGWCEEHAVSAEFLDLGARLNYPALDLSAYCSIGAGVAQWEDCA